MRVADAAGRDGGAVLLCHARARGRHRLALAWTDNGYNSGAWTCWAAQELGITTQIVCAIPGWC